NGLATVTPDMIDNGSSDNCEIASLELDVMEFNCDNVGENTVTLMATDVNENVSSATAIVTVVDNIAAKVLARDITIELDEMGMATITIEDIDNGSNDACGIESLELDVTEFTCNNVGLNTVTLTANDVNGNVSSATATITVEDNIAPVPVMEQLDTIYAECIVEKLDVAAPLAIDNCQESIEAVADLYFPVTRQGSTVITWKYEDAQGNVTYQQQEIIIEDTTAPVANVAELETIEVECGVTDIAAPMASDNCAGILVGTTSDALNYSEQGEYMITWTYDDGNGNTSTQDQLVIVNDVTTPDVITRDITIVIDPRDNVRISPEDIDAGSSDNCSDITLSLDQDYFEQPGFYDVTLSARDAVGNTGSAIARVTVVMDAVDTKEAHVVPTLLRRNSKANVILPFRGQISSVEVIETETNRFRSFSGNKRNKMEIDVAPFKGTLLVRITDIEGTVYLKKLIAY
ncbi:MAG: hypothetical protein KJP01_07165, partial [Gramella sp.]|nr:hypothetical protein [Christiangramia sp.]